MYMNAEMWRHHDHSHFQYFTASLLDPCKYGHCGGECAHRVSKSDVLTNTLWSGMFTWPLYDLTL